MAIIITDECINCGACEPECPNTVDADAPQTPISDDIYYIVPGKCTECKGFHDEPQCAAVCPVDCCVPDENHVESEETLLNRQAFLHNE